MNGAAQAGLRAAAEILEILRPQALCSEDYGALEASRPATKPARGLSQPRWMLQPRKSSRSAGFVKWTVVFCTIIGVAFLVKRYGRLTNFFNKV
jgi:hypothetical protein